jgi:DNA-directed RNA polymerase subunit L
MEFQNRMDKMEKLEPRIEIIENNSDTTTFTLSGINVSLANALRRTLLSDIPMVVFRTTPNEQNKCVIFENTSRLNNEIIKQRLSCIPIHITNEADFPINNYLMEVQVENNTDNILYVTTEDFVVKDVVIGKDLSKDTVRQIFPPNDITGYYIDFVRLRPRISAEIPGEKLHLTCKFDIGTAKEDGMFNAVSTCSYGFTIDTAVQEAELAKKMQTWKDEGKNAEQIKFDAENWRLLEGKRIFRKDSFDFIVQSVGVYTNDQLLNTACKILIQRLEDLDTLIEKDELEIKLSENTLSNSFDVVLENEDYTIGKVIEYFMHTKFYQTNMLSFCGFKKMHPHDTYSIIRVAYSNPVEKSTIKGNLKECIQDAVEVYTKIKRDFLKLVK